MPVINFGMALCQTTPKQAVTDRLRSANIYSAKKKFWKKIKKNLDFTGFSCIFRKVHRPGLPMINRVKDVP